MDANYGDYCDVYCCLEPSTYADKSLNKPACRSVERSVIPKDYKNHPKLYSDYLLATKEYYLRIHQAVELYNSVIPIPKLMKKLAN